MQHDNHAFLCSIYIKSHSLLCIHVQHASYHRLYMRSGEAGTSGFKTNVPVTPHCSPGRSVSRTPPADVALGGKLCNPLSRGCWIKTRLPLASVLHCSTVRRLLSAPPRFAPIGCSPLSVRVGSLRLRKKWHLTSQIRNCY